MAASCVIACLRTTCAVAQADDARRVLEQPLIVRGKDEGETEASG